MKILRINVLRGPNYWSQKHKKLIVLKIDLEKYKQLPSNLIPGFAERLITLLPLLKTHEHIENGFVASLKKGISLDQVIAYLALELQLLTGMNCTFSITRSTGEAGIYHVVFAYEIEEVGLYAAKTAFNIAEQLASNGDYSFLEKNLVTLKEIYIKKSLGPSTQAIVDEAISRDIPISKIDVPPYIILGQGINQQKIWTTVTSQTSSIGVDIASNKGLTKKLLKQALIPVPQGIIINNITDLDQAIELLSFPLVIKPINGNHGRGTTTNIRTHENAHAAFHLAKMISKQIIIEQFITGDDYRFLVVNYKVVAVSKRERPCVIGDGVSTIQQLIDLTNLDPKRGIGHTNVLTKITIDETTLAILKDKSLTLQSILPAKEIVYLKYVANLSAGGSAGDVTDKVHPFNILLAERAASLIHLDLCGIDVMAENINEPITESNGAVIEINAGPGLRMHTSPSYGQPRNVAKDVIDMLYPFGKTSTIPIVAVTGTNGKTTTIRLIAHLATQAGYKVGFTTTDGIYIDNHLIYKGDCSGPRSAQVVLQEPTINFAALECARGGIIRSGLGFNECDISIILNITNDHLGIDEINSLEDLARVKSAVAHSTKRNGYAILNADDDLVYGIKADLTCNVGLFSIHSENPRISLHCSQGGTAAYIDNGQIILMKANTKITLCNVNDLPITFGGTAQFMFENVLAGFLAGVFLGIELTSLCYWLKTFTPSAKFTPGRMNLFNFKEFQVLIDYAHNVGAYRQLKKYLETIECRRKVGIIAVPGDRRAEDIIELGYCSALMFDVIIIRYEKKSRGRANAQISQWLVEGIESANLNKKPIIIDDEHEALQYALNSAQKGDFIVFFPTNVSLSLSYLEKIQLTYETENNT